MKREEVIHIVNTATRWIADIVTDDLINNISD